MQVCNRLLYLPESTCMQPAEEVRRGSRTATKFCKKTRCILVEGERKASLQLTFGIVNYPPYFTCHRATDASSAADGKGGANIP